MTYTPTDWKDRSVEYPNRFEVGGEQKEILPDHGVVTEEGTPRSAENFNKMEQGIGDAHDELDAHVQGIPISQVPIGNIIVDLNSWQYKDGDNYSGDTVAIAPVRWIKVAQDHEDWNGATLLSERLIGKYNFDAGNEQAWETSDIRAWLNSVFKESLSTAFQGAIKTVTTKTKAGHTDGSAQRTGDDDIFLLSEAEMAGAVDANDGVDLGYFTDDASRICQGAHEGAFTDWAYWVRSPNFDHANIVRIVSSFGGFYHYFHYADYAYTGVRPALNFNNATIVNKMGNVWVITQ